MATAVSSGLVVLGANALVHAVIEFVADHALGGCVVHEYRLHHAGAEVSPLDNPPKQLALDDLVMAGELNRILWTWPGTINLSGNSQSE